MQEVRESEAVPESIAKTKRNLLNIDFVIKKRAAAALKSLDHSDH
ncbi:hypothetical protein EGR_06434 [Echinococcus granulosus]|uniref:Uncharacterized protein n=1 Tax=Echinococcus granulosus TaxID=6210 RepID=W6UBJ7_ECHGR|nr:hypothetical protein EGR_06434 [Echinococcus granulosus]EUB58763.1 hypothetical protein EGR_06434 [Echinococcus granulosus]